MSWPLFYLITACAMTFYTLGIMHEKGHTHWKNGVAAFWLGMAWPVAVLWGIWIKHRKETR